jgi:hypothetical protein
MARHSDPQNRTASASPVDRLPDPTPSAASPVDRFLASTPTAPRAVDRRADARLAMLGGRARRPDDLVIREAGALDAAALARLAEQDGGRVPRSPVLLATVADAPVAAIGVLDRRVLADPTVDTDAAVDRLQAIAAERRGPERRRRVAAWLRRTGGTTADGASGDELPGTAG